MIFPTIKVLVGNNGRQYYTIDGETNFDINFPLGISLDEKLNHPSIGNCNNCKKYGSFNGIIMTPCGNCVKSYPTISCNCNNGCKHFQEEVVKAYNEYNTDGIFSLGCEKQNCIFRTYLYDIDFCTVGTTKLDEVVEQIDLHDQSERDLAQEIRDAEKKAEEKGDLVGIYILYMMYVYLFFISFYCFYR